VSKRRVPNFARPDTVKIMAGSRFAVLAAALTLLAGCTSSASSPTATSHLPDTPVVFVHGYNEGACPGVDVTHAAWGGAYLELTRAGWRGPLLPVSYYACDHDGVDITGYGPSVPSGATPTITSAVPRVSYNQNTSIEQLAHDLGWFIYDSYTQSGKPVDLVAVSMGGLIVRDLLYRVAHHDSNMPPKLLVTHAVTISTPYLGYGATGASAICPITTLQCQEFAVGSSFLTTLNGDPKPPEGDGGTTWSAAGSSAGCDFVPAATSLGLAGAQRIDYLTPCYTHVSYLFDGDANLDATARLIAPDGTTRSTTTAPHSLRWLLQQLS
jgi:hypothetical protein